mgnify:CR=1 FL=1
MRLEVFSSRSRGLGIDSRLETRDFQRGGCFFPSDRLRCANRKCSKVFEAITIRKDFTRHASSEPVSPSRVRRARPPPPPTYLLQRFSFPPRGGDNPSRRGRFKMLARVGASRATEATSRGKKAFKESFPARVLFVSTPVTRGANDAAVAS